MRKEAMLVKNMSEAFNARMLAEGVVCYGASKKGEMAIRFLETNGIMIRCFCDSSPDKWGGEFLGNRVISPEQLEAMGKDVIIYISSAFAEEIHGFLTERGFRYIIKPQDSNMFFDKRYDYYIVETGSLALRFYETLWPQLNVKGFLTRDRRYGNNGILYGKPVITLESLNNENKDVFIFQCDFAGKPYGFGEYENMYDGAKILFLAENYAEYHYFLDTFFIKENKYGWLAHVLDALSNGLGLENPKYADIGANEPISSNNTYVFYEKGGAGQLFEPMPQMCEQLRRIRPRDNVINAGIGLKNDKNAAFYVAENCAGLSTFLDSNKSAWENRADVEYKEISVEMMSFNDAVDPETEIVSLDCEGMDFDIVRTIDFDKFCNIKILRAETPFAEMIDYMDKKGFALFWADNDDYVFVRRALFDSLMADRLCREMYYFSRNLKAYYNIPSSFLRKF